MGDPTSPLMECPRKYFGHEADLKDPGLSLRCLCLVGEWKHLISALLKGVHLRNRADGLDAVVDDIRRKTSDEMGAQRLPRLFGLPKTRIRLIGNLLPFDLALNQGERVGEDFDASEPLPTH